MSESEAAQVPAWLDAYRRLHAEGTPVPDALMREIDDLFAKAQPQVFFVCRRIVGDDERALDIAQDALLTGYRKLHTFRGEGQLSTWLYGIAKGLSLNAIRRRRDLLTEDGVVEQQAEELGTLSKLRREEREALFQAAASELSELEQEAIYLRYVEEMPQERITEVLGITQSSGARGVLQACRRKLGRALRARLQELGHGSSFFQVTRA